MRFKNIIRAYPKLGTIKIKDVFLIVPMTIGDETRWLEYAKIKYMYKFKWSWYGTIITGWDVIEWLDK